MGQIVVASKDRERRRFVLEYWLELKQDEPEVPNLVVFRVPNAPNLQQFQHLKHQLRNQFPLHFVFPR